MEADTQAHVAFFLTGRRPASTWTQSKDWDLRPALFAGYRDLTQLRYDFPAGAGRQTVRRGLRAVAVGPRRRRARRCARAAATASASANTRCAWSRRSALCVAGGATGPLVRAVGQGRGPAARSANGRRQIARRQPAAHARGAQGRRRTGGLRRGAARAPAAPRLERGAKAKGRSIPQGPRPAGAEALGHPQGRFRTLRGGPQRRST